MTKTTNTVIKSAAPKPLPRRILKWFLVLLGFIFLVLLSIAIGSRVYHRYFYTDPAIAFVQGYVKTIGSGNVAGAYALSSSEFRAASAEADLLDFVGKHPALKAGQAWEPDWNWLAKDGITAGVKGWIVPAEGEREYADFRLKRENGEWKVLGLELGSTAKE